MQGVGYLLAARLLRSNPAGAAAGVAGNFRFGAPPACRNFCLRQARLGCNLARNAAVPSPAPFCGRNISPLENPERTGETPHLPARNSFAFFRRERRIRARHVVQGRVHFYLRRLRFRPHALLVVSVGKFNTRRRRNALFARGLMCIFPAISARKGADERKVGFSQNIETPQKYMRNFRKLPVPVQTAHGYPCVPVPTGGSF